jgi:sugar phosphate isomerase/epimerase
MNTPRRTFLKMSSIAIAGTALRPDHLFASERRKEILGIQLYSVRDDMGKDPVATLKKLAAMGYRNVEHANYKDRKFYGYPAKDFKKLLDDQGLKMPSGHVQMGASDWDQAKNSFTDQWKQTIEDAVTAGQQYLIDPWMDEHLRKDYNGLIRFLELFNKCGELCKKSGLKFGYHNHDFEFNTVLQGKRIYEIILKETDPSLVAQQMDIGNMYNGGGKALDLLKAYPGRFALMHVKDEIRSDHGEMGDKYESTVLGKGILPVKSIIDLARERGGTSYFIVEQESYQQQTPLQCAGEDYGVMKKWGF